MKTLQKLIYGDRNLFVSTIKKETKLNNENKMNVVKFLMDFNVSGYSISNMDELFYLSNDNFDLFITELFVTLESLNIEGYVFRKNFANSIDFQKYTNEDWTAMLAQYSLTYNYSDIYEIIIGEKAEKTLSDYKENDKKIISTIKTENKTFSVNFEFEKTITKLAKDIMESKIVLREQQIQTLQNIPTDILEKLYKNINFTIKEIEIVIINILIDSINPMNFFNDTDQIVRIMASKYLFRKDIEGKLYKIELNGQITNSSLKGTIIKIPTRIKKSIVKSLNEQKNIDYTVEKMFKYYGFWKKILTASKFLSKEKTIEKFPVFSEIQDKLYENDRSQTFNGKIENFKKKGDYNSALKVLSTNPGFMLRNIFEYLRYVKDTPIAKKEKIIIEPNETKYEEDNEMTLGELLGDVIKSENKNIIFKEKTTQEVKINHDDTRVNKVLIDASEFLNSKEFIEILSSTNTKLLWHILALLKNDNLYKNRTERIVQGKHINYEIPLPAINKKMAKTLKKKIKKSIKKIKKEENTILGKVYIDDSLNNYNVQFSGRASNEIVLSGEYLSPGSKIPFSEITGKNKILRLGVAWKGNDSCDIDHSLNLLESNESVYYGKPELIIKDEIIISSSGDITSNSNSEYSIELIDIDIDKSKELKIGNIVSSLIQYSGKTLNNYEVLWFMNIIDKKDRIIAGSEISIELDKIQYAIQINEETRSMLGFHIDFKKEHLEVLNIPTISDNFANAESMEDEFKRELDNRPKLINMKKAIKNVIKKSQIVKNIEEANIIISSNEIDFKCEIIHPGRNGERLNNIIF